MKKKGINGKGSDERRGKKKEGKRKGRDVVGKEHLTYFPPSPSPHPMEENSVERDKKR